MARHYTSAEAKALYWKSTGLCGKIFEKQRWMDVPTQQVLVHTVCNNIQEIHAALHGPGVRHIDAVFASPDVSQTSNFHTVLTRLKRQAHAACVLADMCHNGADANAGETAALSMMDRALDHLDEAIAPVSSLVRTSTKAV